MVIKAVVEWKNPFIRTVSYVLFFPFSLLFGLLAELRNRLYDVQIFKSVGSEAYIMSVGSLSVGGSGKTPLVEYLAKLLSQRGLKIGVVSNGYGKRSFGTVIVSDGKSILADVFRSGDEAFLMATNFQKKDLNIPVISGPDRVEAVRILTNHRCNVIILDDAFQYRKITKSIEFIVQDYFESRYPFFTLPAGRLREFKGNLNRAKAVVLTKSPEGTDAKKVSERWNNNVFISHYEPVSLQNWYEANAKPLDSLMNKKIILFSALGFNESFQQCVTRLCSRYHAEITHKIEFQDHHWYVENDLRKILGLIPEGSFSEYLILTTQKDAVKIQGKWIPKKFQERAYFLISEFSLDSQIQFENLIKIPQITSITKAI